MSNVHVQWTQCLNRAIRLGQPTDPDRWLGRTHIKSFHPYHADDDSEFEEGQYGQNPTVIFRGEREVDTRTDIYSLGCTFYHAICGRPPFDGPNAIVIVNQHLTNGPVPPTKLVPGLAGAVEAIILKCMEKDRENRYQNCAELVRAIDEVIAPPPPPAPPPPAVTPAPARPAESPAPAAAATDPRATRPVPPAAVAAGLPSGANAPGPPPAAAPSGPPAPVPLRPGALSGPGGAGRERPGPGGTADTATPPVAPLEPAGKGGLFLVKVLVVLLLVGALALCGVVASMIASGKLRVGLPATRASRYAARHGHGEAPPTPGRPI